ncbi:phosphoglycerate mutase family protein [Verrucomicrobia bacterium]|jgi:broad specificity phosphatase PhoE|nr:phosphoglycerate mutase family protein [Verrucomicrobiota bacterium]
MSELTVIRHGQASFFSEDYDQLSSLGKEQAELLGQFLGERGRTFDEVYLGPKKRHRETFDLLRHAYLQTGRILPEPVLLDGLDEYGIDQFVRGIGEEELHLNPKLGRLHAELNAAVESKAKIRAFQTLFQAVAERWMTGELGHPDVECWDTFKGRVGTAVDRMTQRLGSGRQILAISSAGTIGLILQRAIGCSNLKALELSWRIRNTALSEFLFSEGRFGLDMFNTMSHLRSEQLWTYR